MLTPAQIKEIAERAEKATAGPWNYQWDVHGNGWNTHHVVDSLKSPLFELPEKSDAEFVSHARTDIPALLTMIEELEQYGRECQRVIDSLITQKLNNWANTPLP